MALEVKIFNTAPIFLFLCSVLQYGYMVQKRQGKTVLGFMV